MKFPAKDFFISAFDFIKENPTISYSLLLIVLLPLVLYFSTFFTIQSLEGAVKTAIESQATMNRDTLALLLSRGFPDKDSLNLELLQRTIDSITGPGFEDNAAAASGAGPARIPDEKENGPALENIRVVVKEGNVYKALAAQNHDVIGQAINTDPSLNGETLISYNWTNQTIDVGSEIEEGGKRYFRVAKPLIDPGTKEIYALIVADIPTDAVFNEIAWTVWQSYAILILVIILCLFLVFQHTRLFSFVALSKRLQAQNKAKDDFIRMATHELRSPVTVLNAYTEALKDELAPVINVEQKQYLDRMSMSIRNLADLMADILEVSHIQQGRTDFKPEKIMPAAVISEIVNGIKPKAEEKGLKLSFESENFSHAINVNLVCFKRIITNLVENSVKYTPAGTVLVSIRAETVKKRAAITIQDTGLGISAEGQARLFEQFYRVKTRDTEGIPGTGLGLWMSREMARKMGGDIMLESIEHMGSRFFVYFPLAEK